MTHISSHLTKWQFPPLEGEIVSSEDNSPHNHAPSALSAITYNAPNIFCISTNTIKLNCAIEYLRMVENIFLFVPNLIGYLRVLLALVAFYYMPFDPVTATGLYSISCLLDAFDGAAARRFGQSTKFGAVLDMLTDRCGTTCLIMVLCNLYPAYLLVFQCLVSLDIVSHWAQMYATLTKGGNNHKNIRAEANPLLKIYYKDRVVLFVFCACAELFYLFLYLMFFFKAPFLFGLSFCQLGALVNIPIFVAKQIINIFQLQYACLDIAAIDVMDRQKASDKKVDAQTVCSETSTQ